MWGMDKTKALAGGGAWMIAAALQIVPQVWPNFLRPHPWAVASFVVIGGAMFAYGALRSKSAPNSLNSGNVVGGDNSGRMIFNVQNYHEAPSHAPLPPMPTPSETKKQSNPHPFEFKAEFKAGLLYDKSRGEWREAPLEGNLSLVLWITNPLAGVGEHRATIPSVAGHLKLHHDLGRLVTIPRAYWLDQVANDISISAGKSAALILGSSENGVWSVYENHREVSPYNNSFFDGFCLQGPMRFIQLIFPITIDVTLVTGQGMTLAQKQYAIHHEGTQWRWEELL
jgi:hypothetical protein